MRPSALVLSTLLALLAGVPAPAEAAEPPGWTWEVSATADLRRLDVRLCFDRFQPRLLTLPHSAGGAALRLEDAAAGAPRLVPVQDGWTLEPGAAGAPPCVRYSVDVAALAAQGLADKHGRAVTVHPSAMLLVPARFEDTSAAWVRFALPEGLLASVPWPEVEPGRHRVASTAFLFESRIAIGRFATLRHEAASARFDVAVLDGARAATDAGIERWLAKAATCVAALYGGRFPVARVQVIVEPVEAGDRADPVVFGRALQAGGSAVLLYLAANATDDALPLEWIAVHELTHLGMPWIATEDAWLSEGFVTLYQETLRGRAGHYGRSGPWQALSEGFARGRRGRGDRPLAEESRTMRETHAFHRVYWAGAALALRIDLGLRAESGGKLSLDDALRLWTRTEFTARRGWRGIDLLTETDRRLGTRSCREGLAEALASREFPDTDALLARLGITRDAQGRLTLSPDPAFVALRRALGGGE